MISYAQEERVYMDFARAKFNAVFSFCRRSTDNNKDSSNIHIQNQIEFNNRCINDTIGANVKRYNKVYEAPQSGFVSYSKSYVKNIAKSIKRYSEGTSHLIVVSSLGRLSREWNVIERFQNNLRGYDVYIQFSQRKYEKSKIEGVDYRVIKLSDVSKSDLVFYKEEVAKRQDELQQERVRLAISFINNGIPKKEAYKMCKVWQGSVKAYQAKHPFKGRFLDLHNGRNKKRRKVLKLLDQYYYSMSEIASKVGYSVRNVYMISAKHKMYMARLRDLEAREALRKARKLESSSEKVTYPEGQTEGIEGQTEGMEQRFKARDDDS